MNGLRLRSNPATLLAYRNLTQTQFGLNNTLQRLSSGLRINKAADDSASSAISTRMSNQIRGMKQANENSQQVNNLIQTAESGLNDISGILGRMRELATQAATDTLNDSDRASINLEFRTLKNEISRVAHATEYNEMNLLNGTDYKNEVHRANTTADDVIGISVKNAKLSNDIRKGIYTLSDRHINVSDRLADISISGLGESAAITAIRYGAQSGASSIQPALGEIYTIKSQVNSGTADITTLSGTHIDPLSHDTSPTVQPGDHTIVALLKSTDDANLSNYSLDTAVPSITKISQNATSVVQPGDHTIEALLKSADDANLSNYNLDTAVPSISKISQDASSVVQPGDHTIEALLKSADDANLSNYNLDTAVPSITKISQDASSVVQPGDHTIEALLKSADDANLSNYNLDTAVPSISKISQDASSVVQPGDHTIEALLNSADDANLSNYNLDTAVPSISKISQDASSVVQPGDHTIEALLKSADDANLSNYNLDTAVPSISKISQDASSVVQPGDHTIEALLNSADDANLSNYNLDTAVPSISKISQDASSVVQPGDHTIEALLNSADDANLSNYNLDTAVPSISKISQDASSVVQPGDHTIKAKVKSGTADISNLSGTNQVSHDPDITPGTYTVSLSTAASNNTSSAADTITFDLIIGNSSNGGENVDPDEEIVLEYSLNGSSWTHMATYGVDSSPGWTTRTVNVPPVAQTSNTQFRWRQLSHSGDPYDHWGLDNVKVGSEDYDNFDPNTDNAKWSSISGATAWSGNGSGSGGGFTSSGGHNKALQFRGNSTRQAVTNAVSVMTSSSTGTVQVQAPNGISVGTASYEYTSSSQTVNFSDLGLQMTISDGTALASELSSSQTFTVNPTLEVTPPSGSTDAVEQGYTFASTSVDFSDLGLTVDTNNAQAMTTALLSNGPQDFTVNARLKVTAPDGTTTDERLFGSLDGQSTVDFPSLGLSLTSSDGEDTATELLGNSEDFTVNARLKVTAPDGTTTDERLFGSLDGQSTVDFPNLGLSLTSSDGEDAATELLGNSEDFTVNARLKVTAPDGTTTDEIQYDSLDSSSTVNFSGLGLTLTSSDAEDTATKLLNNGSEDFTVNARLKVTAPDGTTTDERLFGSLDGQSTVDFPSLGLTLTSSDAEDTATKLLNNGSEDFTVNARLKVTAPDGTTTDERLFDSFDSQSTVDFPSLGLTLASSDGEDTATKLLNNGSEDFTVNARLKVTAPDGTTTDEIQYDSRDDLTSKVDFTSLGLTLTSSDAEDTATKLLNNGSEDFTVNARLKVTAPDGTTTDEIQYDSRDDLTSKVDFTSLGLTLTSSDAEDTATKLLNNGSEDFTVNARLKVTAPDGTTTDEIQYDSRDDLTSKVSFGSLDLYVDSDNAQTTATTLLDNSKVFTVNPTLAINSPSATPPVEEIGYQFHDSPQTVDFPRLGFEVDTSDAPGMTTTLLDTPWTKNFFVPETRELTMTGENGVQQSLEYRVGYDTTLNFDKLGIQLDIKGSPSHSAPSSDSYNPHTDSLDGKQIEIAPNRDLQVGADNDVNHQLKLGITSVTASGLEIGNESVVDIDQARAAITSLDTAIDVVNQERSYLGSEQNRLAFTMSNLTNQTQSIEASRSSIQDADFASDAASLAKNQILAQSATAMLAQASAISQNILSLITA